MLLKSSLVCLISVFIFSCQQIKPHEKLANTVPQSAAYYNNLANTSAEAQERPTQAGIVLHNDDFPIEVKLYDDNTFYYLLPTLGDGRGTWEYKDGHINLHAKRSLFDMSIDVYSLEEGSEKLAFSFVDRHGWQFIEVGVKRL